MDRQIEFDIKMRTKDIYKFLLCHTYSGFGGWFGVILSVIAFVLLVTDFDRYDDAGKMVLIVIALAFTVVNPFMLLSKAKQQILTNAVYKKPLHYAFTGEGIKVSQEEQEEIMPWDRLQKTKQFGGVLIVYTSKVHAFIFPLDQIGELSDAVTECIASHLNGGLEKQ